MGQTKSKDREQTVHNDDDLGNSVHESVTSEKSIDIFYERRKSKFGFNMSSVKKSTIGATIDLNESLTSSIMSDDYSVDSFSISYNNDITYNSINLRKIYWNELEIDPENINNAIIGHGTFGNVFKARWRPKGQLSKLSTNALEDEDIANGIIVAVKILSQSVASDENMTISNIYKDACKEVKLIRSAEERMLDMSYVVHPFGISLGTLPGNLSRAFCVPPDEKCVGITMRYEAGGTLETLIHNQNNTKLQIQIPLQEKIRLLSCIARGLAELHAAGVVHADIKPENILLSHHQPCRVRLADFGLSTIKSENEISKLGNSCLRMTTTLRGTPIYCAPEILINIYDKSNNNFYEDDDTTTNNNDKTIETARSSRKSDMYSFGILMWEVLTQIYPFLQIRTEIQLMTAINHGIRPALSDLPSDTPLGIIRLMEQCWNQDRTLRKTAVECNNMLQFYYTYLMNRSFDLYFLHSNIPQLFISHILYYFMRLGYHIGSDDFVPQNDRSNIIQQCPVLIVCLDSYFQASKTCINDLKRLKQLYPNKVILTLIIEEKSICWLNNVGKDVCNLVLPTSVNPIGVTHNNTSTSASRLKSTMVNNTTLSASTHGRSTMVDIGPIGRGLWNTEEGPNTSLLTALYKNLEAMKVLILSVACTPFSAKNLNRFQGMCISVCVYTNLYFCTLSVVCILY